MTPKQVWGTIIIVLGVLVIINSATKVYEAGFYGKEILSMGNQLEKYGGKKFFNTKYYAQVIEQEKTYGVVGFFVGIGMSVGGTLLLSKKTGAISGSNGVGVDTVSYANEALAAPCRGTQQNLRTAPGG